MSTPILAFPVKGGRNRMESGFVSFVKIFEDLFVKL